MCRIRKLWASAVIFTMLALVSLPVRALPETTVYVAGNDALYPLEYYEDGAYQGIFPRLLGEIGAETGLEFVYLPPMAGVTQYQRAQHRQVELVSCLVRTGQWAEENYMTFSEPLYRIPLEDGTTVEVCLGFTDLMPPEQLRLIQDALMCRGGEVPLLTAGEMKKPVSILWWGSPIAAAMLFLLGLRLRARNRGRQDSPHILGEGELCDRLDHLEAVSRPIWYLALMQLETRVGERNLEPLLKPDCIPAVLGEREAALLFSAPSDVQAEELGKTAARELGAGCTALLPLGEYAMASTAILSCARQGCVLAGRQGTGWIVCSGGVRQTLTQREMLRSQLRSALEKEQFELYIQPIVRSSDGVPVGGEALTRWDHPTLGFLSPGRFLNYVRELGLETVLDHYQLRRVCQELVRWRRAGREDLYLHCNVSRATLTDDAFPGWLGELLAESGLPGQTLTIEVTEEQEEPGSRKRMLTNLRLLKRMGLRLALDDYGTGATCPEDLWLNLYDVVKLDASLLYRANTTEGLRALEDTLTQIHAGGAIAVGEGAETPEQAELLRLLGCDRIQGYFYYRPLPQWVTRRLLIGEKGNDLLGKTRNQSFGVSS